MLAWRKTVTIDRTQCGTDDSVDFPLTIWVTDADLKTVGNGGYVQSASGYDIRPYVDRNLTSALTFQLVRYVASSGLLEMHVKLPVLTQSTNLVFYLGFGDTTLTSDASSTATWDSSHKYVMHGGDGTTIALNDAGQSGNTVTNNGATAVTGTISGGAQFAAGSSQYASGTMTYPNLPVTITGLVKLASTGIFHVLASFDDGSTNGGVRFGVDNTNKLKATFGNVADYQFATVTLAAGTWYVFAITISGASGTAVGRIASTGAWPSGDSVAVGTPTGSPVNIEFGRTNGGGPDYLDGILDEVRISNVVRSASWLTATYNNLKTTTNMLTFGARETTLDPSWQPRPTRPALFAPGHAR